MQYKIVHLSAECYPIAKTGGLGDVVGALPKYLHRSGELPCVILPRYNQAWNSSHQTIEIANGELSSYDYSFHYQIRKVTDDYGFDIFLVDIPELLFRENIYGYQDDPQRFIFFQLAVLDWLIQWKIKPQVIHCHDHHTGLVPFMTEHCVKFEQLKGVKTLFTIHNGLYTGSCDWSLAKFLPEFNYQHRGLLDWDNSIHPLATGIKCCTFLTTVSGGYLEELQNSTNNMKWLYNEYQSKSYGIVNGIDSEVWNPKTDHHIPHLLEKNTQTFKSNNKKELLKRTGLNPHFPLMIFIGRLVHEKGGELLLKTLTHYLRNHSDMNFYVLGSGTKEYEEQLQALHDSFPQQLAIYIGYNEELAHQLYAAADFLVMPSLVEPCGLNQLYAMRYATVPVVRAIGGLKDTVVDIGDEDGYGIRFNNATMGDVSYSIRRCLDLFEDKKAMLEVRNHLLKLNYLWESVVEKYIQLYNK